MNSLSLRVIPVVILVGLVMVLFIQHQDIWVDWVGFGRVFPNVSLGLLLLTAYGAGLLLGILWELLGFLRDRVHDHKTQRHLRKLEERIALLEQHPPQLPPVNWTDPYA